MSSGEHGLSEVADAGAFLARLNRLDPAAVVRLRPAPDTRITLWARLPWGVLVARTVAGAGPGDVTVSAADLLAQLAAGGTALPARRDFDWRWPLPASSGQVVETLPAAEVRRLAGAAASALRTATEAGVGGRALGSRVLRDALLDHIAIVVSGATGGDRIEVPQRLVQGVVRMGFLGTPRSTRSRTDGAQPETVQVRQSGRWVGLSAPYGIAWLPPVSDMRVKPGLSPTNG